MRSPGHPASAASVSASERQLEMIRYVVGICERDAGPTIGEVEDGAWDRGVVRQNPDFFQDSRPPNVSAVVHALFSHLVSVWNLWSAGQARPMIPS